MYIVTRPWSDVRRVIQRVTSASCAPRTSNAKAFPAAVSTL